MASGAKGHRRAQVVMAEGVVEEVDALVGQRRRSRFITEAVEEKPKRRRRVEAVDQVVGSSRDGGIPEWETAESTEAWVRALRDDWAERSKAETEAGT